MENNRFSIMVDGFWVLIFSCIFVAIQTAVSLLALMQARQVQLENEELREELMKLNDVSDSLRERSDSLEKSSRLMRDELDLVEDLIAGDS